MKKYIVILTLLSGFLFCQDRSVIFNTGSPDSLDYGYYITASQSIANKFSVSNDYVLEAMVFYMTLESQFGSVDVSIREDDNGIPGENVSELSSWNHTLSPMIQNGYNVIVTTDLCIYLNTDNYYWFTIEAGDPSTQAKWIYSNAFGYQYSSYDTETDEWTSQVGYAGAGGIWAEQIYEAPYNLGDVNFDFSTNVVDIVLIVGHILGSSVLDDDAVEYADINSDATIDVVDLVQLINLILTEDVPNPDFSLEDINPESDYFGQNIGPSFFDGQVSAYYFGKQG